MAKGRRKKPLVVEPHVFYTKVVGVTHNNPDASSRQTVLKRLVPDQPLSLIREPENRYDQNAIMVCTPSRFLRRARQIGYLSAELANEYARLLDAGGRIDARISEVTGGGGML